MTTRVLFVCHGNICRSPMGDGMFQHLIRQRGLSDRFDSDSAGTHAEHIGEPPDSRMQATAREHGVALRGTARQFTTADFDDFDLIVAMDRHNKRNILHRARSDADRSKVVMMRDYDPASPGADVPDPWYGGLHGFTEVFHIVERATSALIDDLAQ